ncbi:HNH endonuclease [Serratia marcescens]|uniref:HNH endonuclease n=1 Tax=Serratia marcescens TaxID=615 RepID=UPI0009300969|nr:HNH endonuclease [Serratia marcescens]
MINLISHDELKKIIHYDPDTGIFVWALNRMGGAKRGSIAGTLTPDGYVKISVKNKSVFAHRLAWFYLYGKWPSKHIDHIDRDKSNNRISNLREATRSQNGANIGLKSHNTSGFRGVSYSKEHCKWFAQITHNGKKAFLGYYKTPELANEAYQKSAKDKFREYFSN